MMTIYIDTDHRCRTADDGAGTAIETDFFDGKCGAYIEGYRYVPTGASWTRPDGAVFHGEMIAPWRDYRELDAAQRDYERRLLAEVQAENADMRSALEILEVTPDAEME